MPFLVDWSAVNAMGSLAMQAGTAVGRAAGNQEFRQRQDAVDAQVRDINQRNREIGYNQTWNQINQRTDYNRTRALQQDAMAADYDIQRMRGDQNLDEIEARGRIESDLNYERAMLDQQTAAARQQAEVDSRLNLENQHRMQYIQARTQQGISQEQADAEFYQNYILRRSPDQQQGGTATQAPGVGRQLSGEIVTAGQDAAARGDFAMLDQYLNNLGPYDPNNNPQLAMAQAQNGAYRQFLTMPIQHVQQIMANPSTPAWARQAAQQAMVELSRFGSNQPPVQPQGYSPSSMSNEDLYRALR